MQRGLPIPDDVGRFRSLMAHALKVLKSLLVLATTLLISGCMFVGVYSAGPADPFGFLFQSRLASLLLQLSNGAGVGTTHVRIGEAPSRPATFFSSAPLRDIANANGGSNTAALRNLAPTYTSTDQLTSASQGQVLQSIGTASVQTIGLLTQEVPVLTLTERSRAASLIFAGGGANPSSDGSGTQAIGAPPDGAAIGRQSVNIVRPSHVVLAVGDPFSGSATGQYDYTGALAWTLQDDFSNIALGAATVTVNFGGQNSDFSVSGSTADEADTTSFDETGSIAFTSASDFTFNPHSGRFSVLSADVGAATGTNGFRPGGSSATPVHFALFGTFNGVSGQAVTGIFVTLGDTASEYVGGFVASGAVNLPIIAGGPNGTTETLAPAIARGAYDVDGHGAAQDALFLVPRRSNVLLEANHASQAIRDNALVGNLGTIGGTLTSYDAPARLAGDIGLALQSMSSTMLFGGKTSNVTLYRDREGDASLLLVAGQNPILAIGGAATSGVPASGAYTWEGVQFIGDARDLSRLAAGRFTLTATFSAAATASFSYTGGTTNAEDGALGASGLVTRASGVLESSSNAFSLVGLNGSTFTQGRLIGRLSGAGATAVSGVFLATDTGADDGEPGTGAGGIYGGGFVGGAPQVIVATHEFAGADDNGGLGEALVNLDADATRSRLAFVVNDLGPLTTEANVTSDSARAAGLLDSIVTTGTFGATTTALGVTGRTGGAYSYKSGTVGLDLYAAGDAGAGDARLFVIDGSDQSAQSVIAHAVKPRTGALAGGSYTWQGVHLSAPRASLHDTTTGRFQLTATLGADATGSFTYTTIGASAPFTLSGTGTVTKSTGAIASSTFSFDADAAGAGAATQTARLQGEIGGGDEAGLAGLFATTGTVSGGAIAYAGGFVGTGKQDVDTLLDETANHVGLGFAASRNIGTGTANGILIAADDYDALLETTQSASDTARGAAIIANLAPAGLGISRPLTSLAGHPQATANERTGGSIAFGAGGTGYAATSWDDAGGAARLLFLDGTSVANSGSFFVAGGDARPPAAQFAGSFSWEGVLVHAGRALHSGQSKSGFKLTADFDSSGAGTFSGTTASGVVSVGVTVDADTGRISKSGTFRLGGSASTGEISGFVSGGAAQSVSGVFTTRSGTIISGGFVGGAPRVGRDIVRPGGPGSTQPSGGLARGFLVGEAARDVFGVAHASGSIVFLGDRYVARRDAVNVASDEKRARQLLSSLGGSFRSGVTQSAGADGTRVTRYTLSDASSSPSGGGSSVNSIVYGDSVMEAGSVFEDEFNAARLYALRDDNGGFLVAGGSNLSGTVSGAFDYEGVFVSATQGALGALREGRFRLTANFASGGGFTFLGTTTNAGAQTGRLEVASSAAGQIDRTTGRINSQRASYIEGAGTARTHDARIEGGIFGAGGRGVAGLFTTTAASGANHAGGFVGSVQLFAYDALTQFTGRPDPASEGFATSRRIVLPVIGAVATNLFTPDYDNIIADANSSVQATRQGAYLRQFAKTVAPGDITAGTAQGNVITNRAVSGYSYPVSGAGATVQAKLTQDWLGLAGVLAVDAAAVSQANADRAASLLVVGGAAFTGSLSGQYTWTGIQLVGESNALETLTREAVEVTASFTNSGAQTFSVATQGSGKTNDLTGTGSVDVATGALGGTGISLSVGGVSQTVSFAGSLHGGDGASLSGVFANSAAIGGKYYAGAILASGALDLAIIVGGPHGTSTTSAPAIARGLYNVNGHGAAQGALFLVPQGSGVLFAANHASANVRNNALATNLGAIGGAGANFDVPNRAAADPGLAIRTRSATVSHGGATSSVTVYEDRGGNASLLAAGGSSQLLASGGAAATGVPTTGAYTWEGVQLLGGADDLAGLTPGRFTLTTTFSGAATAAFSYTGGTTTAADGTLTVGGNITNGERAHSSRRHPASAWLASKPPPSPKASSLAG